MQQETLTNFDVFKKLVESKLDINNTRIQKELKLFSEAPQLVIDGFLEAYQAIHIDKIAHPQNINECDSYIAYKLGITTLNPENNQAHFPVEPSALPDIDSDFANPDLIKDYLREKYGADHVIGIPTYGKYKVKSLLTDLCRVVLDEDGEPIVSFEEIKALTKKLPQKIDSQIVSDMAENEEEAVDEEDLLDLEDGQNDFDIFSNEDIQQFGKKYPKIFRHFQELYALPKFRSMHAAGTVITPKKARDIIPMYLAKKSLCAEYSEGQGVSELSSLGFIKIDILGLKTEKVLDTANHLIMSRYNFEGDIPSPCACKKQGIPCETNYLMPFTERQATGQRLIDLYKLCQNVPKVYKNLSQNKNEGVFQLEPEGISNYTSKFEPKEFYDIALITAAYRPGLMDLRLDENGNPLDTNSKEKDNATPGHMMFIERRKGRKQTFYPSEKVRPILESAFGLAVFQENLSQMIMAMTNCSFAEAEKIRKFLTKVKPELVKTDPDTIAKINKFYQEYKSKALKNNCTQKELDAVWNMILPFARYGFAKSHAIAYSLITYQTSWMRTLFPLEFFTSLMIHNVDNNKKDKIIQYIRSAQNLDFEILKPDINKSNVNFTLNETNQIVAGLTLAKSVGDKAALEIIKNRDEQGEFTSLEDFLSRPIAWKNVNVRILNNLVDCGAFDSIEKNRKLAQAKININKKKTKIEDYDIVEIEENGVINKKIHLEDFSEKEKRNLEREIFGFDFNDPLQKEMSKYKSFLKEMNFVMAQKKKAASIGTVEDIKTFMQKNGQQMARITVTNLDGIKEQWILFANVWKYHKGLIKIHEPYCVVGKKDEKSSILADTVRPINELLNIND